MRLSLERTWLVGAVIFASGLLGACANGTQDDDYDGGYTAPASTGKKKTSAPDATTPVNTGDDADQSSGDDQGSPGIDSGDDGGADATTDDSGDDAADDSSTGVTCSPGQTCVDMAPPGWSGYVQLRLALADAGTGSCALPYAAVQLAGVADPSGAPAQCTPCTCGTGTFSCSAGMGTGNLLCIGTDTILPVPAGGCVDPTFPNSANGATYAPTVPAGGGGCSSDGGVLVGTPDAATAPAAIICALGAADGGALPPTVDAGAATPATCTSSQACAAPIPSQAGPSGVCIFQAGITTCPVGTQFTDQHIVGSSIADTRGCGCSCAPAACPTDGVIEGFNNSSCTGGPTVTLDAGGSKCLAALNNSTHFTYVESKSHTPGTCAPAADAGPSGGVSVDTATGTTLCCIP
jgi:hypothetical protein